MFVGVGDVDGDGRRDVVATAKPRRLLLFQRQDNHGDAWRKSEIPFPEAKFGRAKGVAIGDLDGDGRADLAFSCESAVRPQAGVGALLQCPGREGPTWKPVDIGGPAGVKFDLVELIDLDGDGDLDLITCEEREGLGVVWYENPGN